MEKYIEMFKNIVETEQGQEYVINSFFEEYVGLGEMYLDIVEIRGKKYISNTENMEICRFEDFIKNEILIDTKRFEDFIIKICNKFILDKAIDLLNKTIKNINDLVDLYELNNISSELLNGIDGYPKNWESLDEELAKLEDFRDNIIEKMEIEG